MLTVAETLRHQLDERLKAAERPRFSMAAEPIPSVDGKGLLASVDLGKKADKDSYKSRLPKLQARLNALSRDKRFAGRAAVVVFEGNDAAGKGGAIRRVVSALDARFYDVARIGAPTDEEKLYPYLWRFWRALPRQGRFTIFDRSWYGRVLVERVEGYAERIDWIRAYGEINDFEHELHRHGIILTKFWLAISPEEQARRFAAREESGFKRFKISHEDWRNREKWAQYEQAVTDMVDRTSSGAAPWTLVPAEDKRYARLTVLETLCDRIEDALDRQREKSRED